MNIKYDPNQPVHNKNVNYHRDAIYDYEEKVDREKERWRELAKQTREKCNEGIRRKFAEEPGYANQKAAEMRAKGGDSAREEIAMRKADLQALAEECNCTTPVVMTWDKQDKVFAYLKKLKEARARIKAEREKSL